VPSEQKDGRAGQLYPEEVSAYVVAQLLAAAELQLNADVSKAVISVPAYFSEAQRDATVTAGRIAGLDTVKLIRWGFLSSDCGQLISLPCQYGPCFRHNAVIRP